LLSKRAPLFSVSIEQFYKLSAGATVSFPFTVFSLAIINSAQRSSVEVKSVIIAFPIHKAIRAAMKIQTIRMTVHCKTGSWADDQRNMRVVTGSRCVVTWGWWRWGVPSFFSFIIIVAIFCCIYPAGLTTGKN